MSSPRLDALEEKEKELLEDLEAPNSLDDEPENQAAPKPGPQSPTSGLTSQIGDLNIEKGSIRAEEKQLDAAKSLDDEHVIEEPPQRHVNSSAPPLPKRNQIPETSVTAADDAQPMPPHADDKPAPLFAGRPEKTTPHEPSEQPRSVVGDGAGESQETNDATHGGDGDSNRSALLSASEHGFAPQVENDVDGQPIVGDYLKMQFVEHKVVPTILVS